MKIDTLIQRQFGDKHKVVKFSEIVPDSDLSDIEFTFDRHGLNTIPIQHITAIRDKFNEDD